MVFSDTIRETLQHSRFRRLWAIGAVFSMMRWLDALVLGVFVYELTGSAFKVALIFSFRLAPQLFLSLLIGTLADRFDRRQMLRISLLVSALIYASVALLIISGMIHYWLLAAAVFGLGICIASEMPLRRAMIGDVMPPPLLGPAVGIDMATSNINRVLGPLIGGLLLQQFGAAGAYLLGALLFFTAVMIISTLSVERPSTGPRTDSPLRELLAGLRYIRTNDIIISVLLVTIVINLFGVPYVSLLSPIAIEILAADPLQVGILSALEGCGAFLGSLLIAARARPAHYLHLFFYGSLLFLCCIFLFSRSHSYPLSAVLLFSGGFGLACFSTLQSTILISTCDPALRGRVFGTLALCIGAQPLGTLQVAYLTQIVSLQGTVAIITGCGIMCLGIGLLRGRSKAMRQR
jgi:MFS family permease